MNNYDVANGLVFQALHIKKDTFDERLISQKKVFLLQEQGVNLGYSYSWYIRGPYSPDLTSYLYNKLDVLNDCDLSKFTIMPSVLEKIRKVNALEDEAPPRLTIALWYELLASVLYIKKKWPEKNTYEVLKQYKPVFTNADYESANLALQNNSFYA